MSYGDGPWRQKEITERQTKLIRIIERDLGYTFTGASRGDASDFIEKYKPELDDNFDYSNTWGYNVPVYWDND